MLFNLVSKAVKFTPAGGTVRVEGKRTNGDVEVEVRDSGRGLAPDEVGRLFKPFSQVHDPKETKERGTGLGLYICKGIVERHGGRVGVESAGLGHGSTFRFVLPIRSPAQSRMAPMPAA